MSRNPKLVIDLDATKTVNAFLMLADGMRDRLKAESLRSAEAVVREAQARVARRTGETLRAIHAEETHDGTGYVVLVTRIPPRNVPYWLEYGTKTMKKQPFLFAAAALEEGPHADRVAAAVRDVLAANGLGE